MHNIINFVIIAVFFIYSVILHEVAHGLMAYIYGDTTAKNAGRLSLNPIKHIDIIGTLILPTILFLLHMPIFGWAKPVPVNTNNIRSKKGILWVSIIGVIVNFILMILSLIIFKLSHYKLNSFLIIALFNFNLFMLNILPLPPLDGYHFLTTLLPPHLKEAFDVYSPALTVLLLLFVFSSYYGKMVSYIFSFIFKLIGR